MLFAIKIPSLGITAAVEITHPARSGQPPRCRTDGIASSEQTVNRGGAFRDTPSRTLTESSQPRGVSEATTIPAASSYEERQLERVRLGLQTIEDASRRVEAHRNRRSETFARGAA